MSDSVVRTARIRELPPSADLAWGAITRLAIVVAVVAAAALGWVAAPTFAATYKWTDANGRVVYSDQPPTGNYKVESLAAPAPPSNPNAVKELATKEAEIQQKKQLRAEEDRKAAKVAADTEKKREQCGKARGQLAMLQANQTPLYQGNDKGEQVLLDDAARIRERQQVEIWMRENCSL